jgi:hypothetical protein
MMIVIGEAATSPARLFIKTFTYVVAPDGQRDRVKSRSPLATERQDV